jgi:hypothetical protein
LAFFSGFATSIAPGNAGKLVKSIYLRRIANAPINTTRAVVAAESAADGSGMLALATLGLMQLSYGHTLVTVIAGCVAVGLLFVQRPRVSRRLLLKLENRRVVGPSVPLGLAFLDVCESLYRTPVLLREAARGVNSWTGECVAFFLVLVGLGLCG